MSTEGSGSGAIFLNYHPEFLNLIIEVIDYEYYNIEKDYWRWVPPG